MALSVKYSCAYVKRKLKKRPENFTEKSLSIIKYSHERGSGHALEAGKHREKLKVRKITLHLPCLHILSLSTPGYSEQRYQTGGTFDLNHAQLSLPVPMYLYESFL